jgi:hypothetical protein
MRTRREADRLLPSSAEAKNAGGTPALSHKLRAVVLTYLSTVEILTAVFKSVIVHVMRGYVLY